MIWKCYSCHQEEPILNMLKKQTKTREQRVTKYHNKLKVSNDCEL